MRIDARLVLSSDLSAEEIDETIERRNDAAHQAAGLVAHITGYDNDHRELWEIPAVIDFAARWVAAGGLSLLKVSTFLQVNHTNTGSELQQKWPGIGALEMWLLSRGELSRVQTLDSLTFERFTQDLARSNE